MTDDLFTGTADYYARYRPRYPERLLQDIRELVEGVQAEYLVDWGCGTGEVALPLSPSFKRITAIWPDPLRSVRPV
jgi:tRNA/tmRNA/rRNA uracil-C5-methylase (TrmA/RlmC/RlmD family)